MADIIEYNPDDLIVANKVINYFESFDTSYYLSGNYLINPDLSAVSEVEQKYWKVDTGAVVEMSTEEKEDIDDYNNEQSEANDKRYDFEKRELKYYKMLMRLDRKKIEWDMNNIDLKTFAEDLLADNQDLMELFIHGISNPLVVFIDTYDANNAKFTQAIQDELIGILNS